MPVHATVDDYTEYMGVPPPVEIPPWIMAEASDQVDEALIGAVYDTDEDGNPTDPDLVVVLRRATCAQARPAVEALCGCDDKGKPSPSPCLTPAAARILHLAQLLPVRPEVVG